MQRGWKTSFLNSKDALITLTIKPDATYLKKLVRWSRDTARAYLRDVRFAVLRGNTSIRIYCILKIVANYASDFALLLDLSILLCVSVTRGWVLGGIDSGSQL